MRIWKLKSKCDKYICLHPVVPFTFEQLHMFNGTSVIDQWVKPETEIDKGASHRKSDYPYFSVGLPVMSKKALDILLPIIENSVEILPVDVQGEEYYGINVLKVLDVVDYEKSAHWFLPSGTIMVTNYVLKYSNDMNKYNVFKVTDNVMTSWPFVTDEFKNAVEKNKLKGFEFELISDFHDN